MESLPNLIKLHLAAAWRRKWWAAAAAWATCVAGWLYLAHIPNQFESSARMYVDSDAILVPLLRGIAVDSGSVNQADLMQKTLLSPSNVDKLIEMTSLGSQVKTEEERERLNRSLSDTIKVGSAEKNLFTVTYRNSNPMLARDVVQAALTIFRANQTGGSREEMANAVHFLREQIANYEQQLTDAENHRAEYRAKYFDILPGAANTASRLETARTALAKSEAELTDTQTRLDALKQQLSSIPKLLSVDSGSPLAALAGGSPGQQRLAEAERNLEALRLRFTEAHPDVIAARRLVEFLRAGGAGALASPSNHAAAETPSGRTISNIVYEQVRLKVVEMTTNVAALTQKIDADKREVERLETLAKEAPAVEADYDRLDRDYNVLKKNHDELVTRLESAKIASAADSNADSKVRIIDPPRIAQVPIAPKRQLLISAVLLAAIAAGGGIVVLLNQFDQSFSSVQALRHVGLPVLGGISFAESARGWRARTNTISFIAVTAMLFIVYGGLMLAATKVSLNDLTMNESAMTLVERAAGRLRNQLLEGKPAPPVRPVVEPARQAAPAVDTLATVARLAEHIQAGSRPAGARRAPVGVEPASRPSVTFDREQLKQAAIVDWSVARSRMTEELRIIKRQLLNRAFPEAQDAGPRADVIMVTSAHPREGKTFTALNLAFSIAKEPNHHVLLVDVDGSRQGMRRFLSAGDLPGLLDLVADPAVDVAEAILRTDNPHLSVVLAGAAQQHGPELLASQRMRSLIDEMAMRYDDRVILLDAPPCLFSSDPAALAAIVGQVVFVIEADRTQRGDVEASLELLRACPRISLVLNKTKVATSHTFGSYPYN